MIRIPFQSPATAGGAALPTQQPRLDRGVARRIGIERKRRGAGDVPASPGRAGPWFGILPQYDHTGPGPFRRQCQPPAGGQIVPCEAPPGFQKYQFHPWTARGFQPGAQEIEFAIRVHDRQAGRVEAQQGKPISIENRLKSPAPPRKQSRPCFPLAASAQGEGQGSRLIVPNSMNFMQLPALQPRNRPVGAMRKALCRTFFQM